MSEHSEEHVHQQVRTYLKVFGALLVLTVVTVAISYLHIGVGLAVGLGLLIALIKGGLVASFFMHLNAEKRWVYGVLLLTALFFIFLFVLPIATLHDTFGEPVHYELGDDHGADGHDDGHGDGH